MIPLSGLDVEPMELGQVVNAATLYGDSSLRCFLDVAPPQLVHPSEPLPRRPTPDRHLEDDPWLTRSEPLFIPRRAPAKLSQPIAGTSRLVVDLIRNCLHQPREPPV